MRKIIIMQHWQYDFPLFDCVYFIHIKEGFSSELLFPMQMYTCCIVNRCKCVCHFLNFLAFVSILFIESRNWKKRISSLAFWDFVQWTETFFFFFILFGCCTYNFLSLFASLSYLTRYSFFYFISFHFVGNLGMREQIDKGYRKLLLLLL